VYGYFDEEIGDFIDLIIVDVELLKNVFRMNSIPMEQFYVRRKRQLCYAWKFKDLEEAGCVIWRLKNSQES
jgi:hypothetical protein